MSLTSLISISHKAVGNRGYRQLGCPLIFNPPNTSFHYKPITIQKGGHPRLYSEKMVAKSHGSDP